jgi:TatD DNase family protein
MQRRDRNFLKQLPHQRLEMRFVDAHNHIQDDSFASDRDALCALCQEVGVVLSAVNGSAPADWPLVAELANRYTWVVPNLGVHPWYITDLPPDWKQALCSFLDQTPSGIGEVGIDGWRKEFNRELQEDIFIEQLAIAAERNLPISIHGLRRWGRLLEILESSERPACGFMLHSYGGPAEMIPSFAKLGGYFSCPGFFLRPGREMKLSVFKKVPRERLLIETDAPDQNLPEELDRYHLSTDHGGQRINHPANIVAVYDGLANLLECPIERLCSEVEGNFRRLFSPVLDRRIGDNSPIPR